MDLGEYDTLTFDFTGSSEQSKYGINCTYWASWGGFFAPLFPLLSIAHPAQGRTHCSTKPMSIRDCGSLQNNDI